MNWKIKTSKVLLLLWGIIFFTGTALSQHHYVLLDHPVYLLVDYYETIDNINNPGYQRPYTRQAIKVWLEKLLENPAIGSRGLIQRYLREFSDLDRHLVKLGDKYYNFTGDAEMRWQTQSYCHELPYHQFDLGAEIRGTLGEGLSYQADISTIIYFANLDLTRGYGIKEDLAPVKKQNHKTTAEGDVGVTQIIFSAKWGYLFFGSDYYSWGPARSGNLLLDINQYPLTNLHAVVNFGPFSFIHLVGILNNLYPVQSAAHKEYRADQRKISAHRLEFSLFSRIRIGLSESVIYNRDFELTYLNPLQSFAVGEVYSGDADNNLAGVDLYINLNKRWSTYFELLLDDVDFMRDWFKNYVNKWAVIGGVQWNQPLGIANSYAVFEAVRIEPYVYSHKDSANHYEYYGQSIGFDLEPNSLRYQADFHWFQYPNLWHELSFSQTWHGEGDRIFGIPADVTSDKRFLIGKKESRLMFKWQGGYEFFENMWLRFSLYHEVVNNYRIDDTFNDFGSNYTRTGVVLGLDLNY